MAPRVSPNAHILQNNMRKGLSAITYGLSGHIGGGDFVLPIGDPSDICIRRRIHLTIQIDMGRPGEIFVLHREALRSAISKGFDRSVSTAGKPRDASADRHAGHLSHLRIGQPPGGRDYYGPGTAGVTRWLGAMLMMVARWAERGRRA
jgi:hypothetical protein